MKGHGVAHCWLSCLVLSQSLLDWVWCCMPHPDKQILIPHQKAQWLGLSTDTAANIIGRLDMLTQVMLQQCGDIVAANVKFVNSLVDGVL